MTWEITKSWDRNDAEEADHADRVERLKNESGIYVGFVSKVSAIVLHVEPTYNSSEKFLKGNIIITVVDIQTIFDPIITWCKCIVVDDTGITRIGWASAFNVIKDDNPK